MANITEVSQWENVIRQLENGEAATGGADGLANMQAKQLANRTKWLKENCLPLTGGALNGDSLTWNGNDLAGSAIVAKSLGPIGYIKYASGLIIQWTGAWGIPTGTTEKKVNFPISFPNGVFFATAQNKGHSPSDYKKYFCIDTSNDYIIVYPNTAWSLPNSENYFTVFAIGY